VPDSRKRLVFIRVYGLDAKSAHSSVFIMKASTEYLQRPILLVSCIERALEVYIGVLGFTENYRLEAEQDTFSHRLFNLPPKLPATFITLDLPEQQRALALLAPDEPLAGVIKPSSGLVLRVTSVEQVLEAAEGRGFECLPIKRERTPLQGPPRTEGAFFDGDGYPVVVFDFNP
jgi:catechol 2,3-dioxygenase-like lactoylglutathione lyase family enzyme